MKTFISDLFGSLCKFYLMRYLLPCYRLLSYIVYLTTFLWGTSL